MNRTFTIKTNAYSTAKITFKYEKLGIEYPLANVPTPTKERVDNARKILNAK